MTDIARHRDPAFSALEDALASEGAQARAPAQEVPHFRALTRHDPYPWQRRLLRAARRGQGARGGGRPDRVREDGLRAPCAARGP